MYLIFGNVNSTLPKWISTDGIASCSRRDNLGNEWQLLYFPPKMEGVSKWGKVHNQFLNIVNPATKLPNKDVWLSKSVHTNNQQEPDRQGCFWVTTTDELWPNHMKEFENPGPERSTLHSPTGFHEQLQLVTIYWGIESRFCFKPDWWVSGNWMDS